MLSLSPSRLLSAVLGSRLPQPVQTRHTRMWESQKQDRSAPASQTSVSRRWCDTAFGEEAGSKRDVGKKLMIERKRTAKERDKVRGKCKIKKEDMDTKLFL